MNLIFLGPPGAGKGTHAQLLMNELGIPQISTGDMLRQAMKAGTEMGLSAKRYIEAGELVPDEVVIGIVKDRLQADDCKNGYILDGFPRTVKQAEALATFAKIDVALNIALDDEVIISRLSGRRVCLKCGATYHLSTLNGRDTCANCGEKLVQRKDDAPETVKNRLSVYAVSTAPLIDYYEKLGLLKTVQCAPTATVEENYAQVRQTLGLV
ncbi:MAG: adenylate kinase [Clostridia bacterium]|nr:adenylate kinase [Clostridia bacterium]